MDALNPTAADYAREQRAIDRDLVDEERLQHFVTLLSKLLDDLLPELHPLGHPDRRWHPQDLADDLTAHLHAIRMEQNRLRGPLVLD